MAQTLDRVGYVVRPYRHRFVTMVVAGMSAFLFVLPAYAGKPVVVVKLVNELKFEPPKVTVKAGDTVEWKNVSALVHTVTDDPKLVAKDADYALPEGAKSFNSGNINPGSVYEHTFTVPGTYKYFCIPHEAAGMIAEVVVRK